jgi:hypothetical protein
MAQPQIDSAYIGLAPNSGFEFSAYLGLFSTVNDGGTTGLNALDLVTLTDTAATRVIHRLHGQDGVHLYELASTPNTYLVLGEDTLITSETIGVNHRLNLTRLHYGSLQAADVYFSSRLYTPAWKTTPDRKTRALVSATRLIDSLNFKGSKHNSEQPLEFPRDDDTLELHAIEQACYEVAYSLLEGKDPDFELESLAISSQGIHGVRTSYSRGQAPPAHILNCIPSKSAWSILQPLLRDVGEIKLVRV